MNKPRSRSRTEKDFAIAKGEIERICRRAHELMSGEAAMLQGSSHVDDMMARLEKVERKLAARSFQVAVLALMKSGKSTLINALLGDQYLPSSNIAETARIVRIRHSPSATIPRLTDASKCVAEGVREIHDELKSLNASVRQSHSSPLHDELVLHAPLATLAERSLGDMTFELLDTPGPNEAGTDVLRKRVDLLLAEVDVIIYLLDYTKLKTREEADLFKRLSVMRPELLERFSDRLFFVVNKKDQQNRQGLPPDDTRNYVAGVLTDQVAGLNVAPERVLLVSAEQGLLARLVDSGRADDGAVRDFAMHAMGNLRKQDAQLEQCRPLAPGLFEFSNLGGLEDVIIAHIYENRGRLFLQSVADDTANHIAGFDNYLKAKAAGLQTESKELKRKISRLNRDLNEADKDFREVDKLASESAAQIEKWVRNRFADFRDAMEAELKNACKESAGGKRKRDRLRQRWRSVSDTFEDLESDVDKVSTAKGAKKRLRKAHRKIADTLHSEFTEFWEELEAEAYERQEELFEAFNSKLEPLALKVEDTVGRQLDITLDPVKLQMPVLSHAEFEQEVRSRVDDFITKQRYTKEYKGKERVIVKRGGWCREEEYADRPVTMEREVTRYGLNADALLKYWREQIRNQTDVSVKTAKAVVKQHVGAAIDDARAEITRYRDGYVENLRQSLQDSQSGEDTRGARLNAVKSTISELSKLQKSLNKCGEALEVRGDDIR